MVLVYKGCIIFNCAFIEISLLINRQKEPRRMEVQPQQVAAMLLLLPGLD